MLEARSAWADPIFSPDGRQLALTINDGRQSDIFIYDWARDALSRLTLDPASDQQPAWTPDGRRVSFSSSRAESGSINLYWQRADGTGEVQRLTTSREPQLNGSWHPSGHVLALTERHADTNLDLMMLQVDGDETSGWKPGTPTVFLNGPYAETLPAFSPDGRWIAYTSTEGGLPEVYVRPYPGPGGKWKVSNGFGTQPMWSAARRELFYTTAVRTIQVVSYEIAGTEFQAAKPRPWSTTRFRLRPSSVGRALTLHPDGTRFALAPESIATTPPRYDKLVAVFNAF